VAIELKLGSFDPAHKGQMELYLRWLDRYERRPKEEPLIGPSSSRRKSWKSSITWSFEGLCNVFTPLRDIIQTNRYY
jgi:hypothetical protein